MLRIPVIKRKEKKKVKKNKETDLGKCTDQYNDTQGSNNIRALTTKIVETNKQLITPCPQFRASLFAFFAHIVQELCESRGGRPGLSVLTSLLVSVDVKLY